MRTCLLPAALLATLAPAAHAAVSVRDGVGNTLTLAAPARRVVSLSPHATETLYAIGAGGALVARVDYSDYPPAARRLPSVGSFSGVSLEALMRQRPDLVVVWRDGASPRDVARLRALGVPVYESRPLTLGDVAAEMQALGALTGHGASAERAASGFRARLAALEAGARGKPALSVFLQVSDAPLFTVSDQSFVGQLVQLCGGRNVFGALAQPAPQVSVESVLAARPQAILATDARWLATWSRWTMLPAVAKNARFAVDADLVSRPGPRLADGAEAVCRTLDAARLRLGLTPR